MSMRFKWVYLAFALLAMLLVACKQGPAANFIGTDLTGTQFGKPLSLTDHLGQPRSIDDFKGKLVVLFFGYTHCPDVCPTTMADLKKTMQLLGEQANQVQVLFVTVDPERDTQAVLAQFVPSFDPRFIGLRGTVAEVAANLSEYKVYAAKVNEPGKSGYTMDHSAGLYVFDQQGAPRIYLGYGEKPENIAHDLRLLL
ncbi:SCO family protein [Methylophilus medardicus]|uniref:SCO family protein n=1 Tax=Methylophilus medardicus TaxID=2588534 RepID=A0A5B8CV88_9PROT|nr:SCO family protein [Methylophilus medardicus]QDC44835.1 SCO family protein [Methylophilus medardicus]QDC49842.1 SCO family protein [Methylophilus medardicus]QDC53547.1 SCO family protein [Methylophilus medardicus]